MQAQLNPFMQDPRTQIQETWRCQASQNVQEHSVLCAIDDEVIDSTVDAMIDELVDFEAVKAL